MIAVPPLSAWSLKTKLALCIGLLMLAFAGVCTTWMLHTLQADLISSVTDAQKTLVRSTADNIDEKIEARRSALTKTAATLSAFALGPGPPKNLDAFFASQSVVQELFDGMAVVDATGRFIHDTDQARVGGRILMRPFFRRVLDGATFAMSSPFRSSHGDQVLIIFAAPLHAADGTVSGALLGSINLLRSNFLGRLGETHIGQAGRFTLIEKGEHPIIVMHNDKSRILAAVDATKDPNIARVLAGHEGTVRGINTSGVEALRTSATLHAAPWVLVAVYPTAEAFAGLRVREREVLWITGALCLLAACLAWLMAGWLLRPLKRLQHLMAQHTPDLGVPMAPASFGSAEVRTLVTAYNAMALRRGEFEERLKASERRMRDITDAIPARIAHIDSEGRCTFANALAEQVLGLAAGSLCGMSQRQATGDLRYDEIAPHAARALRGEAVTFECTGAVAGRIHHYQANYLPEMSDSGVVRGFYSMLFDITALKEAQGRQKQVEERLRAITDQLPALIAHVDKDGRYDFLNGTFKTWIGVDPQTAIGRHLSEVMAPEVYVRRRDKMARCLGGETVTFDWEENLLVGRKVLRIEYLPDFGPDGTVVGFYTFGFDVTALNDARLRLSQLVRSDTLTGLPNRYQFNEVLPLALARSARSGLAVALMFIDIDHFKRINDSHGHAAGDAVLKEFALRLQRSVRAADLAARLGGDEFVVVLEGLHSDAEPQFVVRKIMAEMKRPFELDGRLLSVTASVGIAFQATAGAGGPEVLALADTALYQAKADGRNTYRLAAA